MQFTLKKLIKQYGSFITGYRFVVLDFARIWHGVLHIEEICLEDNHSIIE
jgi:hypothetical protein